MQGAPRYTVTADQLWENLLHTYKQVIPVAERAGINVAMHGNDPPLYELYGNPQIMCRFTDFDRLFSEVPSAHNTMTFCVGTRYESGEDIFEGIRHFGGQGKDRARALPQRARHAARQTAATARSSWTKATCTCSESWRRCMRYTTKVRLTSTT